MSIRWIGKVAEIPINHCKSKKLSVGIWMDHELGGVDKALPWWSKPLGQLESYRNFGDGTLFERKKTEMNLNCNLRKLKGPLEDSHHFPMEECALSPAQRDGGL